MRVQIWKLITNKGIMDQPLKKLRKNNPAWDVDFVGHLEAKLKG